MGIDLARGRAAAGAGPLSLFGEHRHIVGVVPDVDGYDAVLAYAVPDTMESVLSVGSIVRVPLVGRSVRGWVVADPHPPPAGVAIHLINKFVSPGPSPEVLALSEWAVWRWGGKRSFYLDTASPKKKPVPSTAPSAPTRKTTATAETWATNALVHGGLVRLPPTADAFPLLLEAARRGPALVITPTARAARRVAQRLTDAGHPVALHPEQWGPGAGGGHSVVGTSTAAWASAPVLSSIVVLDAHDHLLQSEQAPTWHAVDVAIERGRRLNIPVVLVSALPRVEHLVGRQQITLPIVDERHGWARVRIIDQLRTDPRQGLYSAPVVQLLRSDARVVCLLNRKGRASLLRCGSCGEMARCERCEGAVANADDQLTCRRCQTQRGMFCRACGSTRLKLLRQGVARAREELEALAGRPVGEVTKESESFPSTNVLIGTNAVLHRITRADAIVFLDIDQGLLAPRIRAAEGVAEALVRAARIVGRHPDRQVLVQTRQPDHDLLQAVAHGDPDRFLDGERARRSTMDWPPFRALARVSGPAAPRYVPALPPGLPVLGPNDDSWLVSGADHRQLCDALAATPRPKGRLRIEVDPPRI